MHLFSVHREHRIGVFWILWRVSLSGLNLQKPPFSSYLLGAEVAVTAWCISVALDGFNIQGGNNPKVFTDTVQNVASHPQMIPHFNPLTWADLELPLMGQKHQSQQTRHLSIYNHNVYTESQLDLCPTQPSCQKYVGIVYLLQTTRMACLWCWHTMYCICDLQNQTMPTYFPGCSTNSTNFTLLVNVIIK